MNPLPKLDLNELYDLKSVKVNINSFSKYARFDYFLPLDELLKSISEDLNPCVYLDRFFALFQLIYNGVIEKSLPFDVSIEENEALFATFFEAGRILVAGYYSGNPDPETVRELVLSRESLIAKYTEPDRTVKVRHLAEESTPSQMSEFAHKLSQYDLNFDVVIPVMNGGFEIACIAAHIYDIHQAYMLRYSHCNAYDARVRAPPDSGTADELVSNNSILVTEDLTSGIAHSLCKVVSYIIPWNPRSVTALALSGMDDPFSPKQDKPLKIPGEVNRLDDSLLMWTLVPEYSE